MIDSGEDFSNSSRVGDHAYSSHDLGQITTRDNSWWLIVNTTFETSGGPINELDGSLGLDGSNGGVDIFGNNITSVHQAAGHIFSVTRVTFDHHTGGLKDAVGQFSDGKLFVISFLGGDDRSIGCQHKVDTRIRDQVGLKFSYIDVQSTIKTKRSGQRRDDLSNQSVQVGISGSFDIQVTSTDIIEGFIINLIGDISVFQEGVDTQDGVIGFDNGGSNLRTRPNGERDLGFFTIIDGETFHHEAS